MPRWDFVCKDCGHEQEQHFDTYVDSLDAVCPKCKGDVTRKAAAPTFKVNGYNAQNGYAKR